MGCEVKRGVFVWVVDRTREVGSSSFNRMQREKRGLDSLAEAHTGKKSAGCT